MSRAGIGVMRMGNVVGAAISNRRTLEPAEARLMFGAGVFLLALAITAVCWPQWLAVPFAVVSSWLAITLLLRALNITFQNRRRRTRRGDRTSEPLDSDCEEGR